MVAYTDYLVPHFAAAALIGALDYRRKTGKGQLIDVSQVEVGLQLVSPLLMNYCNNGVEEKLKGNSSDYAAPHGVYRCKGVDRWCAISVFTDEEWQTFCKTIGNPDLAADKMYSSFTNRKTNENRLNQLVERWTSEREPEEIVNAMQKAGVSAGLVQNAEDLYNDPQLWDRDCFWKGNHKALGEFAFLGQPSRLSATPAKFYRPSPCLGEHTEFICKELLGISKDEFDRYLIDGVFG